MKVYRFYAEMPEGRRSKSASKANPFPWTVAALRDRAAQGFRCTLVAVPLDDDGRPLWHETDLCMDAVTVAIEGNHYHYGWNSVHVDYLRNRCTRISEDLARVLSHELFRYLED